MTDLEIGGIRFEKGERSAFVILGLEAAGRMGDICVLMASRQSFLNRYFRARIVFMEHSRDLMQAAGGMTLVVDLDGTLIRTDMLHETFWSAVSRRWLNVFAAARALREGRHILKSVLAGLGPVEPALLPYNEGVIAYIRSWKAQGGRVALVSASNEQVVSRIAQHLDLFDDVHGSTSEVNLKGARKAELLQQLYSEGGYSYIGDSSPDLAVWQKASRAVTVDASPSLAQKVDAVSSASEHLVTRGSRVRPLIRALRPHQWLKNVLVFLPILAAHKIGIIPFGQAMVAFVAYNVIASSVYLLNDMLDLEADRSHARKRRRPFASGDLPLVWGTVLTPLLLLVGFGLAALLGPQFVAVMALYYVLTTAYSFWLKRKPIVDICTLASLYTLRIIAGGVATQTPLSVWLLAFSIFFFFSLATMKRQTELVSGAASGQETAHGRDYKTTDLPLVANMAVSSGYVSVLVLALYVNTDTVQQLYGQPYFLWGICLVLLYWLSRMVMIAHRGWMHDDPVVFAATDRVSIVCVLIIVCFAVAGAML